ncbi:MAG TPA: glucose-6-phosphate dehydrogenase, partial [Gaiellaceae bacterium]|nr:glucose-6-phosphate dehydrogenase [Gaiellaceae bacterium]
MATEAKEQQENPLAEGLLLRRTPDPCALVIFGASGDLTHKKLMPALYALATRRLLPPRFAIVGVARTEEDDDGFRNDMKEAVQKHARDEFRQDIWDGLAANMHYVATDFADAGGEKKLAKLLGQLDTERELGGNRVYYLAVPPPAFPTIVDVLGKERTAKGWTRLIVEKPFGHDLASAKALTALLLEHFTENEI